MDFIYHLIIGGIAGWIASQVVKGKSLGLVGNIVIGVLGALVGGWLFSVLGVSFYNGLVGSIVSAAGGAILLLWLARKIR